MPYVSGMASIFDLQPRRLSRCEDCQAVVYAPGQTPHMRKGTQDVPCYGTSRPLDTEQAGPALTPLALIAR